MNSLGIDIGATKIAFLLIENKKIKAYKKIATPKTRELLIESLKKNINDFLQKARLEQVGIGVAGLLDKEKKKILKSPNLKFLNNLPLKTFLEKEFSFKVLMENDGNCFALAEALLGAGKNYQKVVGITLGSGVGGGFVIDKKIYQGTLDTGFELGHMTINFNGPKCACGNLGCLEQYCSQKFFERKKTSPQKLRKMAQKGSKKAIETFQEFGKYLGIGIANISNLLEPEVIVIGGGLSLCQKWFLKTTEKEARKRIFSPLVRKNLKIKLSNLGEKAVALGACYI